MQCLRVSSDHIGCVTGPPWDQCLCLEHRIFWMLGLHWGVLLWSWEGIQFPWRKDLGKLTRKEKIFAAGRCTNRAQPFKMYSFKLGFWLLNSSHWLYKSRSFTKLSCQPKDTISVKLCRKKIKEDSFGSLLDCGFNVRCYSVFLMPWHPCYDGWYPRTLSQKFLPPLKIK